jgi:hypothetical protein
MAAETTTFADRGTGATTVRHAAVAAIWRSDISVVLWPGDGA